MPSKRPQSELVLIHVVTLNYFPLLDDAYNQFGHLLFSSVSLTPYCILPWVGRLGSDDHTDVPAYRILSCNCKKICFFQS